MPTFTTHDGTTIFYKDWGTGQPIVFSHGWPLTADDWDGPDVVFSASAVIASLRMTGAVTGAPPKPGMATTWIPTPTISRRLRQSLT